MTVTTDDVKRMMDLLISHLETSGQRRFEIDDDYYWDIPSPSRYDPYNEPAGKTMGQLSDDLDQLRRITRGERPPLGSDLVYLASIIRRIGEKTLG